MKRNRARSTIGDEPTARRADGFRDLAQGILQQVNREISRTDFLEELAKMLLDFSACDAVELRVGRGDQCLRCEAVRRGTVIQMLVSDAAQAARLIQGLIRIKEERGFEFIEVRTLQSTPLVRNADLGESRFFKHHVLDLDAPAEVLRGRFHRTCVRQRIARAEKSGLTLKTGRTEGDLDEFYGLLVSTRKRKALPTPPYRFFRALWEAFCPADRLSLIFAQKNGHSLAAAMLLTYKDRVSVEYAASDDAFNHLSPVHFLFWEAIRSAREAGHRTFDFGRTSPRNASLMEFKERWGTRTLDLVHFYYPSRYAREPETREDSWKYGLIKACLAFDGLAPVHRALGAFCYRHMG